MKSPLKAAIARHTFYNLLGTLLPLAVSLVTVPLYLRLIGQERYGVLCLVWMLLGYFTVFDLGLSRATSNQIAQLQQASASERQIVFWSALSLNAFFGLLGSGALWVVGRFLVEHFLKIPVSLQGEVFASMGWVAGAVVLNTTGGVFAGTLEGREQFFLVNAIQFAASLLYALVPLLIAFCYGPALPGLIASSVLLRALAVFSLFLAAAWVLPCTAWRKPDLAQMKRLLGYGSWITLSDFIGPVLAMADRFFIGSAIGAIAVTHYMVPFNLADRTKILAGALARSLFPKFSRLPEESAAPIAQEAVRFLGKVMLSPLMLVILLMQPFLALWINPAFAKIAAPVGEYFILGMWLNSLAFIPFTLLQGQRRPDVAAKLFLIEILPFLGILWLGIRLAGIQGAAIAWLLRVAVDTALFFYASKRAIPPPTYLWPAIPLFFGVWLFARFGGMVAWFGGMPLVLGALAWAWWTEPRLRTVVQDAGRRFSEWLSAYRSLVEKEMS